MTVDVDSGTDTIRSFIESGVGVIELNRPERRNALHPEMYDAIPRLVERYGSDDAVGCILLTGAGTAFCAGGDVRGGADRHRSGDEQSEPGAREERSEPPGDRPHGRGDPLAHQARAVLLLQESPKITMAALPGPAVGAGTSLALAADLRIAAESASLITGWARLAFSGDFGGTWFLTRLLGAPRALAALIDNATISSAEALSLGLFNKVVPDEQLPAAAMAWARAIAAGPRTAFGFMKQNVRDATRLPLSEALPLESERQMLTRRTEEHREAVKRWMAEAEARRQARRAGGDE
jgi:2-(1,2-epoxy-1,2-dihydrophenyl)acetyl-CoA isomerase